MLMYCKNVLLALYFQPHLEELTLFEQVIFNNMNTRSITNYGWSIGQYTSLKPLADRVLVKIKEAEEKTSGGILLPTTALTKPQSGEVVAVGEGRTVGKSTIEVGVKVNL